MVEMARAIPISNNLNSKAACYSFFINRIQDVEIMFSTSEKAFSLADLNITVNIGSAIFEVDKHQTVISNS